MRPLTASQKDAQIIWYRDRIKSLYEQFEQAKAIDEGPAIIALANKIHDMEKILDKKLRDRLDETGEWCNEHNIIPRRRGIAPGLGYTFVLYTIGWIALVLYSAFQFFSK